MKRSQKSSRVASQLGETQGATGVAVEPQVLDQQSASETAPAVIEPVPPSEQRGRGRPSLYTRELADEICRRIAEGQGLTEICRDEHMPARQTIIDWSLRNLDEFSVRYEDSRALKYERWADEINEIADDCTNDYMDRQSQTGITRVLDAEHVNRSRLRIDSRKWLLSKLKPKVYGDHLEMHGTIDINVVARRLEQLQAGRERARKALESGDVVDVTPEPNEA